MLKKLVKANNVKLIIAIICIIIYILYNYISNKIIAQSESLELIPQDYNEVIAYGKEEENMYVSVTINEIPYQVAERTGSYNIVDARYYLLFDENDYMYIAKLSDQNYKKISEQYEKDKQNFSYTLTGYIYKTPNDLKKIIIEVYNESFQDDKITEDVFANYFGLTYLDDTYTEFTTPLGLLELIKVISIIIAIICIIKWLVCFINTKKTLSKFDKQELEEELDDESTYKFDKAKIYLTPNYFISSYKGIHVLKYTDISWVYVKNKTSIYRNFYNHYYINMYLSNKTIYKTKGIDVDKQQLFDNILDVLSKKNSNIMIGYTYENLDKYRKTEKVEESI